jgi:hypothetical protein
LLVNLTSFLIWTNNNLFAHFDSNWVSVVENQ